MHYSDGTEALVGDIVRGRGYNLPYDIVGPVTKLVPSNGDTCNIRIETRVAKYIEPDYSDGGGHQGGWQFETYEEAGATKDFTLLSRRGWNQERSEKMVWVPAAEHASVFERQSFLTR